MSIHLRQRKTQANRWLGFEGLEPRTLLALLLQYDFAGEPGNQEYTEPAYVHPDITAINEAGDRSGCVTRGPGVSARSYSDSICSSGWTTSSTRNTSDYYSFGVFGPKPGYEMDLTMLYYADQVDNSGPWEFELLCSLDGFSEVLSSGPYPYTSPNGHSVYLLNFDEFDNFRNLTEPIEFRLCGFDSGSSTGQLRLRNNTHASTTGLVFEGDVRPIAMPTLSINDVTVDPEGNSGTTNALFTVSLSAASGQTVTVNYATADDTATAGDDYQSRSGTLTFQPGQTQQTISVPVLGDTLNEIDERFLVDLFGPVNATISDGQGEGTIVDDDPSPTLSIDDVTVDPEGDTGTTDAVFTVTLSAASGQTVTVSYATADDTATAGDDYQSRNGTLTFQPGQTQQTIAVPVLGDTLNEIDERFLVDLFGPANATITDGQGEGTIIDDDPSPTLSIDDVTVAPEGDTGTTDAVFTVTLSAASGRIVTVSYDTTDDTATLGDDYQTQSGTFTFQPGQTQQTIIVPVLGDTLDEINETFLVNLSGPVNATISDGQGEGTIIDDDPSPTLSIDDVTVDPEGDTGTTDAVFTVTLSAASGRTVTVSYDTTDDTATLGDDYQSRSGTLTFQPGQTQQTVSVPVLGDTLNEIDERFLVDIFGPANATISDGQGEGTIVDDDPNPTLSIDDVTVAAEGDTGTTDAVFTVTLSAASGQLVTVSYDTTDDTATLGDDYQTQSGTLTFQPGQTQQTITVPVLGDTLDEINETFLVNLSGPVNATISDGQGEGTIIDDDPTPTLSINDVTVDPEGNSGTTNALFTVSLSAASGQTVTVSYDTTDDTATLGDDYQTQSGTLTFQPGQTQQTIIVSVLGDTLDEINETFLVNLSGPVNATISDGQGEGTIIDDDPTPTLSINDVTVDPEGNSGTTNALFTVSLSAASGQTVTVNYATADDTATAGDDYQTQSGTLTFQPGQMQQTITVPVLGDTLDEIDERFLVDLFGPAKATITDGQGEGTIIDDDPSPTLSIDDVTVDPEGDTGTTDAVFTVSLSAASGQTVTVSYATANDTATAGDDYQSRSGTLTFQPGQTQQTITVPVLGDTLDEIDERFLVNLSGPTNATITGGQGEGMIIDDHVSPGACIKVDLIAVDMPSPDDGSVPPEEIGRVIVGQTYFVEIWVQQTVGTQGIQGGFIDVRWSPGGGASPQDLNHGDLFTVLTGGEYVPPDLINDFGGATFAGGVGVAPEWARLGYIEMQAEGTDEVTYALEPGGQNFSLSGVGNVDWGEVDLTDTAVVDQMAPGQVDVRIVSTPTTTDANGEAVAMPDNELWLDEWERYWVEIWLSTPGTTDYGITGANVSLNYTTALTSAKQVDFQPSWTPVGAPTIDDATGQITGIHATTTAADLGDDRPVLLARVLFEPTANDDAPMDEVNCFAGPYGLTISSEVTSTIDLGGVGTVPALRGADANTEVWAVLYDIDDNDCTDFGDFAFFAPAFGTAVGGPEPPYVCWADYDKSGSVDFGDFAFFAPAFGWCKPTAPSQIVFPPDFPDSYRIGGVPQRAFTTDGPADAGRRRATNDSKADAVGEVAVVIQPSRQTLDQEEFAVVLEPAMAGSEAVDWETPQAKPAATPAAVWDDFDNLRVNDLADVSLFEHRFGTRHSASTVFEDVAEASATKYEENLCDDVFALDEPWLGSEVEDLLGIRP